MQKLNEINAVYIPHMAMYKFQRIDNVYFHNEKLGFVEERFLDFTGECLKKVFN